MKFKEVTNERFADIYEETKRNNEIVGTGYNKSYEILDKNREYGHMIFKSKQEAAEYIKIEYGVEI